MSTLNIKEQDGIVIASFPDVRLADESRIQDIGKQFDDLVRLYPSRKILLNFANVQFMSSSMIGKILQFKKNCDQAGIESAVCDLNGDVREVFQVMRLDKHVSVHPKEPAAIKAMKKKEKWYLRRK